MGFGDYTEHKLVAEGKEKQVKEKQEEEVVSGWSCGAAVGGVDWLGLACC